MYRKQPFTPLREIPRLRPTPFQPSDAAAIKKQLQEHGHCVVQVISEAEAAALKEQFWADIQAVAPGADQRQQLWLAHIHGIIKSYGVGHWLSLWLARVHPAIRGLFAALYGTEDLIVSFDGGNWLQAGTEASKRAKTRLWPHIDQDPKTLKVHKTWQSALYLEANLGPDDGGFICYPESWGKDWLARQPEALKTDSTDWFKPNPDHTHVSLMPDHARVIEAPAGCLVMWDSRMFHCSRGPGGESKTDRVALYLCYAPRQKATPEVLKRRKDYFKNGRTTSHSPYKPILNPISGQFSNKDKFKAKDVRLRPLKERVNPELYKEILRLV